MINNPDKEYFRLAETILKNGKLKKNRTGIDTIGVFGEQAKFDLQAGFPILTTKKVWFKGIAHELLWFIKGDTNIKYLVDNGVHIWDEWAYKRYRDVPIEKLTAPAYVDKEDIYREGNPDDINGQLVRHYTQEEFIQKIKDCPVALRGEDFNETNWKQARFAVGWGELGNGTYGGMWRGFPCYDESDYDGGPLLVDQVKKVLDKLKSNPDDRRMIVSAWHPYWVDHCALPPCHCLFHFNTEELTLQERGDLALKNGKWCLGDSINTALAITEQEVHEELDQLGIPRRRVNLLLYQRSCDTFLGVPFNITSYSLLLAMVAHVSNMVPGVFTHTYGDLHFYTNHLDQIKTQMAREPYASPKLWLNPEVKSLFDFKYEDIALVDYKSYPAIKGEVAV
jgi:thymidylate synthase